MTTITNKGFGGLARAAITRELHRSWVNIPAIAEIASSSGNKKIMRFALLDDGNSSSRGLVVGHAEVTFDREWDYRGTNASGAVVVSVTTWPAL